MSAAKRSRRARSAVKRAAGVKRAGASRRAGASKRKSSAARGRASAASSTRARKDPRGGLTAKGREYFARKEGAQLKPGVKKRERDMTPAEMRRKGSWASRFYGRKGALPPLRDERGEPTRFALTAAAWGEPVPKTMADARRIAAKGRRLLERYHSAQR